MGSVAHLEAVRITVGVDTHRDEHVAVALDALGKKVATTSMPTTPKGYRDLLAWAEGLGAVEGWGVEGTGSYGAGLARHLKSAEHLVHEVIRPNRSVRRRKGKSDLVDAEAAARAVQAGGAAGLQADGQRPQAHAGGGHTGRRRARREGHRALFGRSGPAHASAAA